MIVSALKKRPSASWSQTQGLVSLALAPGSEPFHAAWLERASGVTVRRLEDDVDHALATGAFDPALLPEIPEGVQIGAEHMGGPETDVWVANVPADVARLFRACLCSVARRLGTPGAALEAMFDDCIDTWCVSTPREHRVFERDGRRCTVPGCTSQRNLHAHHVLFRSAAGRAPGELVFELPLGRFRSGDLAMPPRAASRWP